MSLSWLATSAVARQEKAKAHTAMSPSRLATSAVARPGPRLPTTPKRTKPFSCNSSRGPAPHIACSVGPLLSATAPSPTICREKNRVTHSFVLFETLPRCVPRLACEASQRVVQLAPLRSVLCCRRSRCRPSTSIPSASANSTTRNPRCALYVRRKPKVMSGSARDRLLAWLHWQLLAGSGGVGARAIGLVVDHASLSLPHTCQTPHVHARRAFAHARRAFAHAKRASARSSIAH